MSGASEIPVPFAEARAVVRPEWIDYNGHMNVGYFSVVFDVAADAFLEFLGFTQAFRSQYGSTTFALEQHLNFLREVNEGDTLRFEARLLDFDAKRFHFYQEMFRVGDHRPAASCEGLSAHVSTATRRTVGISSSPKGGLLPSSLQSRITGIWSMTTGGLVGSSVPTRTDR